MNCRWVITTTADKQINLEFDSDFLLESCCDPVTIEGAKGVCFYFIPILIYFFLKTILKDKEYAFNSAMAFQTLLIFSLNQG